MNILTFDIEEWFHILDNDSTKTTNEWENFESRIHKNMERIFNILEKTNQKATFFCLGWIAEKYPEVIREILTNGHEIGSHSYYHQLVYEQRPQEFKNDTERSIKILEDLSGIKIKYYRAPGFSIKESNKWAFEILVNLGIEVDSSIFPAARAHGGFPSFNSCEPSIISYQGINLKELPISYKKIMGQSIIYSGGGYFRLFPYHLIKKWAQESNYIMTYFHPRDFDAEQPMIKDLSMARKFKSYVGLKGATPKLEQWLTDFEFIDMRTANNSINWQEVKKVKLY